ncbi:MSMEG_0570 family nitrogen starvation response protein [Roseiarcaceae bacterium H3SJ34-1]|uniref:MSMEG_0570 family nitrogen starvation response protein n=1 Tax=Terripilifer ovatus TaxID=3032367 RepID=UPI003AB91EAB|nr:MSMEG_0570 family nitrogen starvation response protein [Roseiarcaceae bacterium H3SJ34-1]
MPEMRFHVRWPDGAVESCYSPSLVVKEHLTPGETYPLDDFLLRTRTALLIASDRVEQKYGMPCSLALGQLRRIEERGKGFAGLEKANVKIESFEE